MAHTTRKVNLGNSALAQITITDYVQGGEQFTLAEFGLTGSLVNIFFIQSTVFPAQMPLYPVYQGAGVVVLSMNNLAGWGGAVKELPTTTGVNFTFMALVVGT